MLFKDFQGFLSARDWNRTSTSLRTADFESAASTNSATRALHAETFSFQKNSYLSIGMQY